MSQSGVIDLTELKARYKLDDIQLVDKNKVDQANYDRLYYELSYGVGLTCLGTLFSDFNYPLLFTTVAFLAAGFFFLAQYIVKLRGINNAIVTYPMENPE